MGWGIDSSFCGSDDSPFVLREIEGERTNRRARGFVIAGLFYGLGRPFVMASLSRPRLSWIAASAAMTEGPVPLTPTLSLQGRGGNFIPLLTRNPSLGSPSISLRTNRGSLRGADANMGHTC